MNPNDGEMFSILAIYEDSYQCSIERLDDYLLNAESHRKASLIIFNARSRIYKMLSVFHSSSIVYTNTQFFTYFSYLTV